MIQQINFLKSVAKPRYQFPTSWIFLIIFSVLAILIFSSFIMIIGQIKDYSAVKEARRKNEEVISVFQKIARKFPLLAGQTPLIVQISNLEKNILTTQAEYERITQADLRYGFSKYLITLAKVVPAGLWLSEIMLDQKNKNAKINGYMIKPVNISLLMQALQDSPTFHGMKFNVFYVKDTPDKAYTQFTITSAQVKQEPNAAK